MSVLIHDMEMPQSCGECKFFAWKRGVGQHCAVDDRIINWLKQEGET